MFDRKVYLDHNATTPLHPEVVKSMVEAMEMFGNPSSLHEFGREARTLLEQARENVANLVGANAREIIFVGSGSEANNTVLANVVCYTNQCALCSGGKKKAITTAIEHPCILESCRCMKERGNEVEIVGVDQYGLVDLDELRNAIDDQTALVSVMMANNEIGTVQNIAEIAAMVHEHGALMHTDAVQAVGKIPVDVDALGVDFLTISAHKIYGPKGVGALYVRKGTPFCPLIRGGHQELGRRAGTENTVGIVGLGKAAEMRSKEMPDEIPRLIELRERLREGIRERIPDVRFNGHSTQCTPNTLNVSFEGVEGEAILLYLDIEGIAVSTGSACASGSLDPSHVLLATGVPAETAHGSIRFSLGRGNTAEEIDYVLEKLPEIVHRTRRMSTAYKEI